jgi:hypothetical protein
VRIIRFLDLHKIKTGERVTYKRDIRTNEEAMNNRMLVTLASDGSLSFTAPSNMPVKINCDINLSLNAALDSKNKVEALNNLCHQMKVKMCWLPNVVDFSIKVKSADQINFANQIMERICSTGITQGRVTYDQDLAQISVKKRRIDESKESAPLQTFSEATSPEFDISDADSLDSIFTADLSSSTEDNISKGILFFKRTKRPEETEISNSFLQDISSTSGTFFTFMSSPSPLSETSEDSFHTNSEKKSGDDYRNSDSSISSGEENFNQSHTPNAPEPTQEAAEEFIRSVLNF